VAHRSDGITMTLGNGHDKPGSYPNRVFRPGADGGWPI
jgi:hypothetical protein